MKTTTIMIMVLMISGCETSPVIITDDMIKQHDQTKVDGGSEDSLPVSADMTPVNTAQDMTPIVQPVQPDMTPAPDMTPLQQQCVIAGQGCSVDTDCCPESLNPGWTADPWAACEMNKCVTHWLQYAYSGCAGGHFRQCKNDGHGVQCGNCI